MRILPRPRFIIFLFVISANLGFSQKSTTVAIENQTEISVIDTVAYLAEINRVADSLRDAGDYQACLQYARKGLELYPEPKPFDYSGYDLSDTVYTCDHKMPYALRSWTKSYGQWKGESFIYAEQETLFNRADSSLFSGLIVSCCNRDYGSNNYLIEEVLYDKGKFITARQIYLYTTDTKLPSKKIYAKCPLPVKNQVIRVISNKDYTLTMAFYTNGDTARISKIYGYKNYDDMQKRQTGDTAIYLVSLQIKNQIIQRELNDYGGDFPSNYYYYRETRLETSYDLDSGTERESQRSSLTLDRHGDTLFFKQFFNDMQNGLEVSGCHYDCETGGINIRLLWKNDTVIDILNENILFLKRTMRRMSEEKFMKKHVIIYDQFGLLTINTTEMIRIDEAGKTWIAVPYKNYFRARSRSYDKSREQSDRKSQRFYKKLDKSPWKQKMLEN